MKFHAKLSLLFIADKALVEKELSSASASNFHLWTLKACPERQGMQIVYTLKGGAVLQVYAAYEYRRDLVEALKAYGMLGRSKALTHSQALTKVLTPVIRSISNTARDKKALSS